MKKLIVANWKMYLTLRQSIALAQRISKSETLNSKIELVLCPSFVALEEVGKVVKRTKIKLGAQDVEPERRGAYTGEVGLDDLQEIGVQYVLVGHSERRRMFGETDVMVNKKLRAVLQAGMKPILCVGEPTRAPTTPNPSSGRRGNPSGLVMAQKYVAKQVRAGLRGVSKQDLARVIIAYEPIWAIGTGQISTPADTEIVHSYIRKMLAIKKIPILYGGSVNSENAAAFLRTPSIDGLLIGKASTDAREFVGILQSVE